MRKKRSAECFRAIRLTVVEVDAILEALKNAKVLRQIDGRQRQQLEEACEQLAKARERPIGTDVYIPSETASLLLECISMTQQWYQKMFAELGVAEVH